MASGVIVERYRQTSAAAGTGLSGLEIVEADGKIQVREGSYYTKLTRGIFSAFIVVGGLVVLYTFLVQFPLRVAALLCVLDLALVAWLLLTVSRQTRPGVFFEVDGHTGELTLRAGQREPRRMPLADLRLLLCRKIELLDGAEFLLYGVDQSGLATPLTPSVVGAPAMREGVRRLGALLDRPAYAVESHALWKELVSEADGRLRDLEAPRAKAEALHEP